jgi:hypothetical protein
MRRALLVLAAWAAVGTPAAPAQSWVDSILPEKSHDFGTVARGSKLRHSFRLVNTTGYDIHIAEARAKCGCTDVKIGARDVPPGTQTVIEATLDTTKFFGYKPSGLTLILDRPEYQPIDLNMSCFIRGDVMLNPGAADFGVVPRGSAHHLALNLTYAGGQPDWRVTKLHTIGDHVKAELRELSRSGGAVQYQLTATLRPAAPPGFFKDEITLLTNDPGSPSIPVSVAAQVQSTVTAFPSVLNLGQIKAGGTSTRDILVRSADPKQPFKLTEIKVKKGDATTAKDSDAAKAWHRVKVTFKAPARPGPYNAVLEIGTDLKDEPPVRMMAFATVVP